MVLLSGCSHAQSLVRPLGVVKQNPVCNDSAGMLDGLKPVSELLVLSNASSCRETQDLAESKLKSVGERIRDLTKMQDTLLQLVARCNAADDSTSCPIIDALVGED